MTSHRLKWGPVSPNEIGRIARMSIKLIVLVNFTEPRMLTTRKQATITMIDINTTILIIIYTLYS